MAKKIGLWIVKACFAGVTAFAMVNIFCFAFSKQDPHITCKTGATDYVWTPNSYYVLCNEGCSYGRFDSNGYNNAYKSENDVVDYLIIGSSQMEAVNVNANENCTYVLNELLSREGGPEGYAYNIGISGHFFCSCVDNLEASLETFRPQKAVIIETMALQFSEKEIAEAITHTRVRTPSYDSGLLFQLQKLPYLKLAYHQIESLSLSLNTSESDPEVTAQMTATEPTSRGDMSVLLEKICEDAGEVPVIILFHCRIYEDENGNICPAVSQEERAAFQEECDRLDITFVDMTDTFLRAYEENHVLPYGFFNTHVGQGHLNKNGHRMIAEKLYDVLCETEVVR